MGIVPVDPNQLLAVELGPQADLGRATKRRVDLVRLDRANLLVRWEAASADMAPLIEAGAERWRRAMVARGGARK